MKFFLLIRILCALSLCCAFSPSATAQSTALPPAIQSIDPIFSNKGELGIGSVQSEADAQKDATPFYKSNGLETRIYEGYFRAASNSSKLALLSDDGASVWVDSQLILDRAGKGQGFDQPSDTTFYPLTATFKAGQIYHLKVEYTNTIHREDRDIDGVSLWAYDGGGEIVTLKISVVATKTEICAGGIADAIHQTEILATVKDNNDNIISDVPVTFAVENSHSEYPAELSTTADSTNSQGQAITILTSSRKISATAKVTAKIGDSQSSTALITAEDAQEDWSISPEELEADDQSQATVQIVLKHKSHAVVGHQITWRINRIWNTDGAQVYDATSQAGSATGYGSLSSPSGVTDSDGAIATKYNVGSEGGTIEFAAIDSTMVANSPRVRTSTKNLRVGFFYVYTYIGDNPSASSLGTYTGSLANPHWNVTLNAIIKRPSTPAPPASINFVRKRYVNGQAGNADSGTVIGNLKANSHNTPIVNWEYWSYAPESTPANGTQAGGWDITKLRGRWQISVQYTNNTTPKQFPAYFKIDKRSQIVETARTWYFHTSEELNSVAAGFYCGDFTAMIYNQLGIGPLTGTTGGQYGQMTRNDNGDGAILFYRAKTNSAAPFNPSHAAIRDGNGRININSNTLAHRMAVERKSYSEMKVEPETIRQGVGDDLLGQTSNGQSIQTGGYADDIKSSSSVDLDAD